MNNFSLVRALGQVVVLVMMVMVLVGSVLREREQQRLDYREIVTYPMYMLYIPSTPSNKKIIQLKDLQKVTKFDTVKFDWVILPGGVGSAGVGAAGVGAAGVGGAGAGPGWSQGAMLWQPERVCVPVGDATHFAEEESQL